MQLTPVQEAFYIKKYECLIWRIVHGFKRRTTSRLDNKDDLYQEACIVFIKYIRSCENEEEIGQNFPFMDMQNAMCRHNIGEQVLSYPKRTTHYRAAGTEDVVHAVDYTEVDLDDRYLDMTIDKTIENMTMKNFLSDLPAKEREIARLKQLGYKNREIAGRLNTSDVDITRTLKRMRATYQNYVS